MSADTLRSVIRAEGEELIKLSEKVHLDELVKLSDMISSCRGNVFFTGCGTSAVAARKAIHTLQVIGVRAFFLEPSDAVHGGLGAVHKGDIVIFLSKGGVTQELLSFIPNHQKKQTTIVSVGEAAHSPISEAADLFLEVQIDREPDTYNMLATASTLATMSVFDAIAINIMQENHYSREQFLINHPSGDVGARLAAGHA